MLRISLTLPCNAVLEPLTFTTPPQFLIIGGLRIIEHWAVRLIDKASVILGDGYEEVRNRLILTRLKLGSFEYSSGKTADAWINPCIVPSMENAAKVIGYLENGRGITCRGNVLAKPKSPDSLVEDCSIPVIGGVWDIVKLSSSILTETAFILAKYLNTSGGKVLLIESNVSSDVKVNVDDGPVVVISSDIDVPAYIRGPALLGPETSLSPFTYVRQGTVAYMGNRLSGEVKNSIFDQFSYKEHHGYVGDAYVGKWVNMGAGTTVSNLKNTMGSVRYMGIDTGMVKLGPVMGDWVKTGINTSVMGGKSIGSGSHIYGLVSRDIPPFVIYDGFKDSMLAMDKDKVYEIIKRTTGDLNEASYAVQVFDRTMDLRKGLEVKWYRL